MKRWTWLMALMLALMIPLQGCTSNPPKDEGEEQNQQEQQKEEQEKDEETDPAGKFRRRHTGVQSECGQHFFGKTLQFYPKAPGRRQLFQPGQQQHKPGWRK